MQVCLDPRRLLEPVMCLELTLTGQQGVQRLGPTFQHIVTDPPLALMAHLTPLAHEMHTRPPLCRTVIRGKQGIQTDKHRSSKRQVAIQEIASQ